MIEIMALVIVIIFFLVGIFLIFHLKDKSQKTLSEAEKSERKKLKK